MANEIGYTSSVIEYSYPVPRHTDLGEGKYVCYLPMTSITGVNTMVFSIPPSDDFIHLQECYIVVKLKVKKADGTALAADSAVALAENVIGTLFKAVSVYLNTVKITESNVYQAVENYFVTRFGIGKLATKIRMSTLQGLTGEAADKNDNKNDEATGWTTRKAWTIASKEVCLLRQVPNDPQNNINF